MARRKGWSKVVEAHGVAVRLYERSGTIYRAVKLERTTSDKGKKYTRMDRKSLGHGDRALAERQAASLCMEVARRALDPSASSQDLTFGELRAIYLREDGANLSATRRRFMRHALGLWARYLEPNGRGFRVEDFSESHVRGYLGARRAGRLVSQDRRARKGVTTATVGTEIAALTRVCNWASGHRVRGRRLLAYNPVPEAVKRIDLKPKNVRRPRVDEARYRRLLEVAEEADPKGRLRLLLMLAWGTGRRINAIVHLRATDVLVGAEAIRAALAAAGDQTPAEHWPAALHWRADWDKVGFESFSPVSGDLLSALSTYAHSNGTIGQAWLFPANEAPQKPLSKLMASYYLHRAEKIAELPKQAGGGWHAFRRAWAHRRKGLPAQDVAAAGGWHGVRTLQSVYQSADAEGMLRAMEGA